MEAPSSSDGSKARRNRTPVPKPLWADMVDPSREKKQVEKEKEKNAKEEPMEEEWWEKDWKDSRKTWNDGQALACALMICLACALAILLACALMILLSMPVGRKPPVPWGTVTC